MKFARRPDLPPETRARIALEGLANRGRWGGVTRLARRHRVSRQFVYLLMWGVSQVFEPQTRSEPESPRAFTVEWDELVLALKLQGDCSEGDISQILKTLGVPKNSIGAISEYLHRLAAALPKQGPPVDRVIVVLADEIFASARPLLLVIEGRSHYILKAAVGPDRKGPTWCKLFEELQSQGYEIVRVVSDLGSGLLSGTQAAELDHLPDLMHLLQPLSPFLSRFERQAEGAIAEEYDRQRVWGHSRSQATRQKRLGLYETALEHAHDAIQRYDDYAYLWGELLGAFDPFHPDGTVRTRAVAQGEVLAILDLMESEFDDPKLHAAVRSLRKALETYWPYFDRLEAIVAELSIRRPQEGLHELCLAWQCEKKSRGAKDYRRKKALEHRAQDHRFLAECGPIEDADAPAQLVFDRLEDNLRSSSPLEAINALIRDQLNSCRGQITQEMLDLIVYFLNHKIAPRGPYKGTSAWQRLTGEPEEGTYIDQILGYLANAA